MSDVDARAACSGSNPDLFAPFGQGEMNKFGGHPHAHPRVQAAFRICAACPIRTDCLRTGLDSGEQGVWGGQYLSKHPKTRKALREQVTR